MDEIKSMLREVLELEGLLMVADSRGDETPDAVFTLIREKVEQLRAVCDCLPEELSEDAEDEELPVEPLADVPAEETPVEETLVEEPIEEEIVDEEPEPEIEPEVEEVIEIEEESESEIEVVPEPEIEEEPAPEPVEEVPEPEEVPEIEEEIEEEIADEPVEEKTITLDEAFIRNKAKDLKSAFSLNDTFRFRRELFGNSAADMNDAIDLVNAMNSYDEAEDYFINDLGWDAESDEVREFMEIIGNHFIAECPNATK